MKPVHKAGYVRERGGGEERDYTGKKEARTGAIKAEEEEEEAEAILNHAESFHGNLPSVCVPDRSAKEIPSRFTTSSEKETQKAPTCFPCLTSPASSIFNLRKMRKYATFFGQPVRGFVCFLKSRILHYLYELSS